MNQPAQHTPGPWVVNNTIFDGAICRWHIASHKYGSAYPICEHVFEYEPSSEEQIANGRLIAAAPDLLVNGKAAIAALSQPVQETPVAGTIEELRVQVAILRADARAARNYLNAAIAKAEGK